MSFLESSLICTSSTIHRAKHTIPFVAFEIKSVRIDRRSPQSPFSPRGKVVYLFAKLPTGDVPKVPYYRRRACRRQAFTFSRLSTLRRSACELYVRVCAHEEIHGEEYHESADEVCFGGACSRHCFAGLRGLPVVITLLDNSITGAPGGELGSVFQPCSWWNRNDETSSPAVYAPCRKRCRFSRPLANREGADLSGTTGARSICQKTGLMIRLA